MTNIKRQGLSLLTALILVISLLALLPEGAFKVYALSGSGTESDPYIITTYTDLLMHTNDSKKEEYIKLANDITVTDPNSPLIDVTDANAIVHLDLAGHTLKRASRYNSFDMMFRIYNKGTLIIDDSVGEGTIQSGFIGGSTTTYQNMFNISDEGTLIINGGSFSNYCSESKQDEIISMMGGYLTINDGDFYGQYKTFNLNRGHAVINGGRFYNSKHICKVNGSATEVHQFTIRTDTNGSCLINSAELISSNNDGFSNPAGITATTSKTENETYKIERFISENTVVYIDGSKIDAASSNTIRGKRILIYTKKAITGMRWEGTKLYWDKYPLASKYGLQIEKPLPGGGYTAVANTATTDTEFDFGMFFENNGVGKYRITVGAETDDGILLSLVTHSNTIEYDPRETVSEISLAVTEPKDGVTITKAIPSSTGEKRYTVTKSLWFKGTSTSGAAMESTEKFVEGQTYTLYCEVRTTSGYKFVSPSATVNGKTAATVNHTGDGIVSLKYTVTAPLNVKTVNVTVTEPVAGAKPSVGDVTLTGTGVVIAPVNVKQNGSTVKLENTVSWFLGDEALDVATSTFEAGKTYTAAVYLKALDGYNLVNNHIGVYINGKQAELDPASLVSLILYGTAIYKADFECEASGQQLIGDVNKDGKISADDAIIVARYAASYGDYKTRYSADIADMNRDGTVSADDAIIIARYSAGYGDYKTRYTNYV